MTTNLFRLGLAVVLAGAASLYSPTRAHAQTGEFQSVITASGPLAVGMRAPDVRTEPSPNTSSPPRPDRPSSDLIARTVSELLPNYIVRGLERGLERRVIVVERFDSQTFKGSEGQDLAAIITPRVINAGSFGVRVSTSVATRGRASVLESEEVLLISPTTNFGELEFKLTEHGIGTAKRLVRLSVSEPSARDQQLPRGIVQFFCVQSDNPDDRHIQLLARRLTVELPYHLTEASKKRRLEIFVRGLEYSEVLASCESKSYKSMRQLPSQRIEYQGWDGVLESDPKNPRKANLFIRASDQFSGTNYRRLAQVRIEDVTKPIPQEQYD